MIDCVEQGQNKDKAITDNLCTTQLLTVMHVTDQRVSGHPRPRQASLLELAKAHTGTPRASALRKQPEPPPRPNLSTQPDLVSLDCSYERVIMVSPKTERDQVSCSSCHHSS